MQQLLEKEHDNIILFYKNNLEQFWFSSSLCTMTLQRLRTFALNFSNIDFFLKILPSKDHELAMSEM